MQEIKSLDQILNEVKSRKEKKTIAVAVAQDTSVLFAAEAAVKHNIAKVVLYGDESKIHQMAQENNIEITGLKIIHEENDMAACRQAVHDTHNNKNDIIMKGNIPSAQCLRQILNKEYGLRKAKILSHIGVFEIPTYHKLIALTDAGINITPDLPTKIQLVKNSISIMQKLGVEKPKVAVLAAVETVNPDMPATLDAAVLSKMAERGQLGSCVVDGPLAMDNAISRKSAEHKKIISQVAGDADILLANNIEVANAIYKSNVYFSKGKVGAFITGASSPVVFTSRSDDEQTKLYSMAIAAL